MAALLPASCSDLGRATFSGRTATAPLAPRPLHRARTCPQPTHQTQRPSLIVAPASSAAGSQAAAPSAKPAQPAAAKPGAQQELAPVPSTANGKLISSTEVAAFIQRDDMMDQLVLWANIEAGEGGHRNFGGCSMSISGSGGGRAAVPHPLYAIHEG